MKKVLALVLALTLFTVPLCTAAATGTDLSGMTNEELTALKEQLDAEMMNRGMVKTAEIPAGDYIIGIDIPQGNYVLTNEKIDTGCVYYQYASQEDFDNGNDIGSNWPLMLNDSAKITLIDGQILSIPFGTLKITAFSVQWQ